MIRTLLASSLKRRKSKKEAAEPDLDRRPLAHRRYQNDLTVRKLTEEEKDDMPAEGVRILEDLDKKKLAVIFRLE